jgi:hypothetical protein
MGHSQLRSFIRCVINITRKFDSLPFWFLIMFKIFPGFSRETEVTAERVTNSRTRSMILLGSLELISWIMLSVDFFKYLPKKWTAFSHSTLPVNFSSK